MAPSVPRAAGVKRNSAPRALRIFLRSSLADSDMVRHRRYPFAAATIARPIPVLPLVASRMTLSRVSSPRSSARSIMYRAGRSFTDPPGLKLSSFAKILTSGLGLSLRISTSGVLPIVSRTPVNRAFMSPLDRKKGSIVTRPRCCNPDWPSHEQVKLGS